MDETGKQPVVMAVDVGGTSVKIRLSSGGDKRKVASGPAMNGEQMIAAVKQLAEGLDYDLVSIGYPGPVSKNRITMEPHNLGQGWVDVDFEAGFGKPVRVVNDALMQAIGCYEGGRMLFIGLGTGLGAALILEGAAQPLELAHLPYKKEKSFEDYVGAASLNERGKKEWRRLVFDVVDRLQKAMLPDYVVIGGGNVKQLDELPPNCRRGGNEKAFDGGFRLWLDKSLVL
jgi:polyphosphate glucokinase